MPSNKYFSAFISALMLLTFYIEGQSQTRRFVNEFLNIGVGAKAHGMMGATTATVDDISAGYWNPAGLVRIQAPFQITAMHAEWFAGIAQYDYVAFGKKFGANGRSFAGLSLIRMGVDQIPNTFNLIGPDGRVNYDLISEFSATDYAFLLSYSYKLYSNLFVGGNVKVVNRNIGKFGNAWGFGFDLGTQMDFGKWKFGVMLRDIPSTFTTWSFNYTEEEKEILFATGNDIPKATTEVALPQVIVGLGYAGGAKPGDKGISYLLEGNLNISTNSSLYAVIQTETVDVGPSLGMELGYNHLVFLRAGIGNLQFIDKNLVGTKSLNLQPNLGLGLKLGRLSVDYALTNVGKLGITEYSHIFSLKLDLKEKGQR